MIEITAQIDAEYFCAGLVLRDDVVVEAAPILRKKLMGRTRDEVRDRCRREGWKIVVVEIRDV